MNLTKMTILGFSCKKPQHLIIQLHGYLDIDPNPISILVTMVITDHDDYIDDQNDNNDDYISW